MNKPLISVIIPNYNHAKYLDQRIKSVLNQTYQNFEVIILDDCSPDNGASKAVIEKYRYNPHVSHIIYNETNSGNTFKQWEKGINLSKGDLCWIAESDDYCNEEFLSHLTSPFLAKNNIVLSFCSSCIVDESGKTINLPKRNKDYTLSGMSFVKRHLSLENTIKNASSALFLRSAALNVSDTYKKFKGAGDYMFWFEIALQGDVTMIGKPLNYFRRHHNVVSDKCSSDGSNMIDEHSILNIIYEKCDFSTIRKIYTNGIHARRAFYQTYDNDKIRNKVLTVWEYKNNKKTFNRLIIKIGTVLADYFDYKV